MFAIDFSNETYTDFQKFESAIYLRNKFETSLFVKNLLITHFYNNLMLEMFLSIEKKNKFNP